MTARLRILVVLPLYGGSLPIGGYCVSALRQLGHLVEVFDGPDFYPTYTALKGLGVGADRLEYLQNSYLQQVVAQAVAAKVEAFEPDLVLAMAQAPLSRQVLKRLARDKVATAMWFVEDYRLFTYWQAYAQHYDIFAVIQKGEIEEELAGVGQENTLYLPLAADPDFHRPLDVSPVLRRKWGADVAFMGAGYPNRRMAFRRLLDYDFKIWGNDWEGDAVLGPRNQLQGRRLTPQECVMVFNATRINLNLHSNVDPNKLVGRGDFVNPRTFELASCAAFQLVDERALLPECFGPDELATFTTLDGLREQIDHYLRHEGERLDMAGRARERVLAEHTYVHRMQRLLEFAGERLQGFGRSRDREGALEAVPKAYRAQVGELLDTLGLSAEVSFDDLSAAVRARQGKLSGLDAAILFLDEWRKQYGVK